MTGKTRSMSPQSQNTRRTFSVQDLKKIRAAHTKAAIKAKLSEAHHRGGFNLPEIILGGQDGLVNVLGVILGVAAATSSSKVVIVAGLAAAFAESVSMAAVAYTSKRAEADYYQSEYEREEWEVDNIPEAEREEIRQLYREYGFKGQVLEEIVTTITADKKRWVKVMMEQELKLQPVHSKEAITDAGVVGFSALVGSFIPLTAFFFLPITPAIITSLIVSAIVLFVVGWYKAWTTLGRKFWQQGLEMMTIGMVSAVVGYLVGVVFQVK